MGSLDGLVGGRIGGLVVQSGAHYAHDGGKAGGLKHIANPTAHLCGHCHRLFSTVFTG
jgi:hypothetical protein